MKYDKKFQVKFLLFLK